MFEPTDEQIEALARVILDPIVPERLDDRPQDKAFWLETAMATVQHPAFQAIIRAAQAQAARQVADSIGIYIGDEQGDYWDGYRSGQRRSLFSAGKTADEFLTETADAL